MLAPPDEIHGDVLLQLPSLPLPFLLFLSFGASSRCLQAALGEVLLSSPTTLHGGKDWREADLKAPTSISLLSLIWRLSLLSSSIFLATVVMEEELGRDGALDWIDWGDVHHRRRSWGSYGA